MSKEIFDQLEKYRENRANVLVPSVLFSDPHGIYEPVLEVIQLSGKPDDKDVYKGTKGFRLTSVALSKIGQCGGVEWDPAQSSYTSRERGKFVTFKAVGGIRKADGRLHQYTGFYNVDLDVIREDLIELHTVNAKKYDKNQAYIDYCVSRDYRQKKKFMLQLAETGARNRVIRTLFSLKSEYSPAELRQPFVMLRFRLRIDYGNPEIYRMAQMAAIQSALGVFGPQASATQLPPPENDVIQLPHQRDEETGADDLPPAADPEYPDGPVEEPTDRDIFEGYDLETKVQTLKEMAARVKYDLTTLKKPMESWSHANILAFYDKLEGMKGGQQNAA